jgi:Mg-chelatase subunit ChlD
MYCSTTIKPSRDIMLLIDTSASMEGRPILEVKYAVSQFLQTIEFSNLDNQRIGLISFGHQGVKRHLPLQRDITLLQGHIAQFNTGGTTALDTALQLALDTFRENPVEADERIIFILSDGHPNQPDKAKTIAMQIKQQDIRIITIGIGTKINSEYLSTIISSCANDYHSIDDPLELRTTFAAIAHTLYPAVIQT